MSFNTTPTAIADLNHFATNVFDYYDGKINLFNRHCNVILDWNGDGSGVLGSYSIPNTVILRMQNIVDNSEDETSFKYRCVYVIIHELFHADEFKLSNQDYYADNDIMYNVEQAVEGMTFDYIMNNLKDFDMFGVERWPTHRINYFLRPYRYYTEYIPYRRTNYANHIFFVIDSVIKSKDDAMYIANSLFDEDVYKIEVNLNNGSTFTNNHIDIKTRRMLTNIYMLNTFFYESFFKYSSFKKSYYHDIKTEYSDVNIGTKITLNILVTDVIHTTEDDIILDIKDFDDPRCEVPEGKHLMYRLISGNSVYLGNTK